jgi:beta-glucoside operon transcriptional antiterminator
VFLQGWFFNFGANSLFFYINAWGAEMYRITKVINNNIVCSVDRDGSEIILRGLGIGFQKNAHDEIPDDKVEKIFKMTNQKDSNKLKELLAEVPNEYVSTCTEIIDMAKKQLGKRLNENIYITLTDHISFAIERKRQNLEYKNALLIEIKNFYQPEYEIGLLALQIINNNLDESLSIDEAGFIALHIVNAELDTDISSMMKITELIQKVIEITTNYYQMDLDEDSLHYERFITHLKFFGQRLFNNKITKDDDATFQKMIKKRYAKDYQCATKIKNYVLESLGKQISEEEMVFLTVHLRRISSTSNE